MHADLSEISIRLHAAASKQEDSEIRRLVRIVIFDTWSSAVLGAFARPKEWLDVLQPTFALYKYSGPLARLKEDLTLAAEAMPKVHIGRKEWLESL